MTTVAIAREEPPALTAGYQKFELTWSNEAGRTMGRAVIAVNPDDQAADGKIWFPKEGTCTWENWGQIAPASFRIDDGNRLAPTRESISMHINGDCSEAIAAFEQDRKRLRIVRKNRPGYTFFVNLQP